jgi:hypothetical protein
MKLLQTEFKLNGIAYKITERSETRYFAELRSLETDTLLGYETGRIIKGKEQDAVIGGANVHFAAKERIPGNEAFGRDDFEGSHSVKSRDVAYKNYLDGTEADADKKNSLGLGVNEFPKL